MAGRSPSTRARCHCGAATGLSPRCQGTDTNAVEAGTPRKDTGNRPVEGQPRVVKEGGACCIHQLLSPARALSWEGMRLETRLCLQGNSLPHLQHRGAWLGALSKANLTIFLPHLKNKRRSKCFSGSLFQGHLQPGPFLLFGPFTSSQSPDSCLLQTP